MLKGFLFWDSLFLLGLRWSCHIGWVNKWGIGFWALGTEVETKTVPISDAN